MVTLVLEAVQPLRAARAGLCLEAPCLCLKHRCCESPRGKRDSAGPNRQLVGLIRSRDPDVSLRRKHNRIPWGGAPCNPMQKDLEGHLRKPLFRQSLPNRAPSTDFSLSATPFHFFSPHRDPGNLCLQIREIADIRGILRCSVVNTQTNKSRPS